MNYAIIDIETTGSNAGTGRITEIAIYIHDGKSIVDEFCSLINPECEIPPFISKLTGITNEMVENAPKFYEVAKQIVNITEDTIFVAHNASFDYNFIRQEYKSLGYKYDKSYLCTLQMSRQLIPGHPSYSLGKLCKNLNIEIENRHRAHGDALATSKLFELILKNSNSKNFPEEFIRNDYMNLRFPPGFNRKIIEQLPENSGVYYFHDSAGIVLYIGKSKNIKKRVLTHFSNKQTRRAIELRNSICDITFEETGNELIALLLESQEIKNQKPFYNRKQKGSYQNSNLIYFYDEQRYLNLAISKKIDGAELLCTLNSNEEAEAIVEKLVLKFDLCKKLCGAHDFSHSCFSYSVKQCKGACIGKESPESYNERVKKGIETQKFENQNFMIIGTGRIEKEKSIVHVEKGKYMGFGFFEPEISGENPEILKSFIKPANDNRDVRQIIRSYIKKTGTQAQIIHH